MKETLIKDWRRMRGDTWAFRMAVKDETLTVSEIHFSCKKRKKDTNYIFHKTLANGGVTLDSDGKYTLKASPSDMDIAEGKYFYDVQVDIGNDVFTPLTGMVTVEEDVTDE